MEHVHFIGIGGVGMSGLAQGLLERGIRVSGSDPNENAATGRLRALGATIFRAQEAGNIAAEKPEMVVVTAAVKESNPELQAARASGVPVYTRAEFLGQIMAEYSGPRVAVAGTHGKTTTTAMLAEVVIHGELDPTVLIGGEYAPIGGNALFGRGSVFVTEACEAYGSFFALHPDITVITNVESDHLDYYGTDERVFEGFARFASQTADGGLLVACADDPGVRRLLDMLGPDGAPARRRTYGVCDGDLRAADVRHEGAGSLFEVVDEAGGGRVLGTVRLPVPGLHNVRNALAALAVGRELGLSFEKIAAGLAAFGGAGRRFEKLGERGGVLVMDDYAHHPTEIAATIAAAREAFADRRLVVVFQPHLFSRTRDYMDDFARALGGADAVVVTDIYPAREQPIPGVTSAELVKRLSSVAPGISVLYVPEKERAVDTLDWLVHEGDVVFVMGAGNIRSVGEAFVEAQR